MRRPHTKAALLACSCWLLAGCGKTVTLNQAAPGAGGSNAGRAGASQADDAGEGGEPGAGGAGAQAGLGNSGDAGSGGSGDGGGTDAGGAATGGAATCGTGGSAGAGTANCTIKTGGDACSSIPKFSGVQAVDAFGDDLCDVPATVFELKKGKTINGPLPNLPTALKARIAWDEQGIHAHFHVDDPKLIAISRTDSWGPDYVELDIGGSEPFSGYFDGKTRDKGFSNIFLTPQGSVTPIPGFTSSGPARASMRFNWEVSAGPIPMPRGVPWAFRVVSGGYEFELLLPWKILGRAQPPVAGDAIALNLGLGSSDDPAFWSWWPSESTPTSTPGLNGLSWYKINALPAGTTSTCNSAFSPYPWCDDRTWCSPTLE